MVKFNLMKKKLGIIGRVEKKTFFGGPTTAVYEKKVTGYCRYPYPGHPQGCPNWNIKEGCPPRAPFFPEIYEDQVWVTAVGMNLTRYFELKKRLHPGWTQKALANSRHWQGHLRAILKRESETKSISEGLVVINNPEALGVNVFATCKKLDLFLERQPQYWVWKVDLLGRKRKA